MKQRIQALRESLKSGEAAIIFDSFNRFYFTGFRSSAGIVIITPQNAFFLIDFRYFEKAKKVVCDMEVHLATDSYKQMAEILNKENIKELFLETETINLSVYERLKERLEEITISTNSKIQNSINLLRSIKEENELESIKAAQEITDKTFSYILDKIKVGKTEREIALDMEFFARKNGSDGVAFDFIVVSGKNSSLPHGVPTDKQIQNGDFITMDFGARVNGYCSDMTRTVAVGEVTDKQRKVYETVLKAQQLAFKKIKAGAVCKDIDAAARDFIDNSGFENCFGHGLGHSLGLEIHENPAFNTRDTSVLKSGTVMTVEPGIYLESEFGVRIEDMVLVTDSGYENFTKSSKKLIIL
ncbi:MAG: aminopeptidase P family protein [Clostridia bacterium]|nr:aminopeptidase P family protein [Clostridia bacterium]